jgi:hypothetical protein
MLNTTIAAEFNDIVIKLILNALKKLLNWYSIVKIEQVEPKKFIGREESRILASKVASFSPKATALVNLKMLYTKSKGKQRILTIPGMRPISAGSIVGCNLGAKVSSVLLDISVIDRCLNPRFTKPSDRIFFAMAVSTDSRS